MKSQKCFSEAIIGDLQIFCPYMRTIINKIKKINFRNAADMTVPYDYLPFVRARCELFPINMNSVVNVFVEN